MKIPQLCGFFLLKMEGFMKKGTFVILIIAIALLASSSALAHYGMVIPSDSMVMQGENKTVHMTLSFAHPMAMVGMELVKPKAFEVVANGKKQDLLSTLKKNQVMGHTAWEADYNVKRPGVYVFCMEPAPYWEPAEDIYIVHYTKTVIAAFGDDEGWDQEIGLKTEIVPLARPFGLYAGNVFQGIVKLNGKAVPYAEVEIEYYNQQHKYTPPTDYMVAQTIKADQNGVFTYAAPKAGWWGFAALNQADYKLKHAGEEKNVEIGAVIWVKFEEWQTK